MAAAITKETVLRGISTCTKMEHILFNGSDVNHSFKSDIVSIRYILEDLLKLELPEEKSNHDLRVP